MIRKLLNKFQKFEYTFYYRGFIANFWYDMDGWYYATARSIDSGDKDIIEMSAFNRFHAFLVFISFVNHHLAEKQDVC